MQYMSLLTAIMMYFCLLFSTKFKQIVSFKPSQGWYIYWLLLFSSFHRGYIWEFKQLISLIEWSWVEGGYVGTCSRRDMDSCGPSNNDKVSLMNFLRDTGICPYHCHCGYSQKVCRSLEETFCLCTGT